MSFYHPIDTNLFIHNRKKLIQHLQPNSLVVLNSNDIMPTDGDGIMGFRQNSDLFYLSGIDQEETILILYPDAPKSQWKEILFIKETNEQIALWEGQKYTQEAAKETSGVDNIYWLHEFEGVFHTLMEQAEHVYLNSNEHIRATTLVESRDKRFTKWCQNKYPLHKYERLARIMHQLRMVKSELEIDLIRQACTITEKGFRRILPVIKPEIMEYEIQAELVYEFIRNRSRGFAYEPIIASGANACILHYSSNNQACKAGSVILLDVAAEYANYSSDLTRVVPVSGRFTVRQRAVYSAVLRIMRQAERCLVPGNNLNTYHQSLVEIIEKELVDLGLLTWEDIKNQDPNHPAYKKYFMHGVSHHLGLNVHDVGNVYEKFKPGMVFTIEPGIYIREEGLGIRLENNYVIRENGVENLMANIPIEADEIESLMQK